MKATLRIVLALFFIGAGVNHFIVTDFYLRMMPTYLPLHLELVQISGVAEVVLGVLLLVPDQAAVAAWGLIALLIAVFPANVHMALHPEAFPQFGATALWLRLPIQALLVGWAFWYTRKNRGERGDR
jgi:uncharacterized membrane protein